MNTIHALMRVLPCTAGMPNAPIRTARNLSGMARKFLLNIRQAFGFGFILVAASLAYSPSASAIDQAQLNKVCLKSLGLRSNPGEVFFRGAGYGMDNGTDPFECLDQSSDKWEAVLKKTIKFIKSFPDSDQNYLFLVTRCPGIAERYAGSFPKCNRVSGDPVSSIALQGHSEDSLNEWIHAELTNYQPHFTSKK